MTNRRTGQAGAVVAVAGLAVAGYLTVVKLSGQLPACGPLRGCETVALSEYSDIAGIPLAVLGLLFSALVALLQLAWWRLGSRPALVGAYGLGLAGVLVIGYLTYLELFVIGAVCVWCVAYGATVVVGWAIAALALRRA